MFTNKRFKVLKKTIVKNGFNIKKLKGKSSGKYRCEFSGERLLDAWILQRKCSPVHFPHLSPLPKRNMLN